MKNGFSLIELLVTIAILGILASLAIPNYQKYRKKPYDVWVKLELSEQSKYLHLAHSVDGGFHQHLASTGYRPSKNLLGNAGFYTGTAATAPCCDIYTVSGDWADVSDENLAQYSRFEYLKAGLKYKYVHTYQICIGFENFGGNTCPKTELPYLKIASFSDHGIVDGGCTNFGEFNNARRGGRWDSEQFDAFDATGRKPFCDCEHFTLLGVTPYFRSVSENEVLNVSNGDGIYVLNQSGSLCKAGSDGKLYKD